MMSLPMVYTALVTPLQIGLLKESSYHIFVIDRIIDVLFMLDMVRSVARSCVHLSLLPARAHRSSFS